MPIKNKVLRFVVAFAAIVGIASQIPVSGTIAFAKNRCSQGGNTEYIITNTFRSNRGARDEFAVPRRRSGLVLYSFFNTSARSGGRPRFTTESSTWTITGTGFSFAPNALVTTASGPSVRIFRFAGAPAGTTATLTAQSQSNPSFVVTVTLR